MKRGMLIHVSVPPFISVSRPEIYDKHVSRVTLELHLLIHTSIQSY